MSELSAKKCVPCEGGAAPLGPDDVARYLGEVPGWTSRSDKKIVREFVCKNFSGAMALVNKVAQIAEQENHHPDILIHDWNKVRCTLSTHAIKGLSENDFILAAKINSINGG